MTLQVPENVLAITPIYRMVHIDCLPTLLRRNAIHAPSCVPKDGLTYRSIHSTSVHLARGPMPVPCGPKGSVRDYVGFYLGPRSPMLYRVSTGWQVQKVPQEEIVYLIATAQLVAKSGCGFVFTDRHSLTRVAAWFDHLKHLNRVDFPVVYAETWNDTDTTLDRQEKKQAEFLVHQTIPWSLITEIGVLNDSVKSRVLTILSQHPEVSHPQVLRKPSWYY